MMKKIFSILFMVLFYNPIVVRSAEHASYLSEMKDGFEGSIRQTIQNDLKALDKVAQAVKFLQSMAEVDQLKGVDIILGITGTISDDRGIVNNLWGTTRSKKPHTERPDNLGALANRISRFETPQQKHATLFFHFQLAQEITQALLAFEENGFIWKKITGDNCKLENMKLLCRHLILLGDLYENWNKIDDLPQDSKDLYRAFGLDVKTLEFLNVYKVWLSGGRIISNKLSSLQKQYRLSLLQEHSSEQNDRDGEELRSLGMSARKSSMSSPPLLRLRSEPENSEVCRKIAREVVMVDENYVSLVPEYISILNDSFTRTFSSPALKKDVLILGAGMAGLVAGKILQRKGYNVTILEANKNRVGGRIKTFHSEKGKESPFKDPNLYAEAGAMRIPTSHPLVFTLIHNLGLHVQPFYNVDVNKDDPTMQGGNTWVRANGVQKRASSYASLDLPVAERHLGFSLPEKYQGKTAKMLLDEALEPLIRATTPDLSIKDPIERNKKLVDAWVDIIHRYDNYNMYQFLQVVYPEKVVVDYIGTLQNLTSRLYLSFIHSFIDTFYISAKTQYREIVGGNWLLPLNLAKAFDNDNIVMNARAVEIQWANLAKLPTPENKNSKAINRGKPGVYIRCLGERVDEEQHSAGISMEREFTADYLVTSIPFSSLRFVNVNPIFCYEKNRSITELHYDSATKVLLEFSERFWEWSEKVWTQRLPDEYRGHDSIGGGSITDSPNRFIYYPSNPPQEDTKGGVVLASYTWSDDANRWDSLLADDRVAYALRGLTDIYGKGILRFYTGKSQTESWMENFYAYGEAAVFSPGQILGLYPSVPISEGPIHFAGEHASMKHAWIEGAIESGIRTALEIIEKDKSGQNERLPERNREERILANIFHSPVMGGERNRTQEMTVASYLKMRLESLGLKRLFGVAGNYTAPFLDTILEDKSGNGLKITGTSNELCAGYAADGYARIQGENGLGAVAVTYGVGAYSLINAVAGSFVEQVPVVVINGAPTNKEFTTQRLGGLLFSHMIPNQNSNIEAFRSVTAASERISNASEAPLQIDAALRVCITRRQPVFLEVLEDVWRATCVVPFNLEPLGRTQSSISISGVKAAVEKTLILINDHANKGKSKPMFWAGIEIQRLGLQELFLSLLEVTGYQYTTAVFGKSLVSEDTPGFSRVGLPLNASCVIGLGAWTTSKDIGTRSINGDQDKAIVSQGSAFVGGELFANVPLEAFMKEFHRRLNTEFQGEIREANPKRLLADELWAKPIFPELVRVRAESSDVLDYDKFFKTLNERWVKDSSDTIVVVDSSFPLIASQQGLHIKSRDGFVAQAAWLSIGYAAPAAIGIKCAVEDKFLGKKRMIVIAGNGAFQETCQAVSSYGYLKQNTVVFVLANGIYGIEQKLVNPNPFREPPAEHSSKEVYEYNNLSQWNYEKLVSVFGAGDGHVVETVEQLESVISLIQKDADKSFIVHVKIPRTSIPAVLKASLEEAGEDEWQHPNWPPKEIF